ncbi:MAG: DUF3370 domain-containing protein [Cyanobacteria bacterium HKST-UBA02]|nr:DUF3370 domain-containing protein [Cyanobacteria bacterium HKST-UBA02]
MASLLPVSAGEALSIEPLPGGLNKRPVVNSNSPEVVSEEGILLSTFPKQGMVNGRAHLDRELQGEFEIFAHHIANAVKSGNLADLDIGLVLGNSGKKAVRVEFLQGASYLSQPDAPFIELPGLVKAKETFAGPGDRVCTELLQGKSQSGYPASLVLKPGESKVFARLPIPVASLSPPINGRNVLFRLRSDGPVRVATLALYGSKDGLPSEASFLDLLRKGDLAGPREGAPSDPEKPGPIRYGRVSGVAAGSVWEGRRDVAITADDTTTCFPIASLRGGTFGTGQVQSAPLMVRYPDTAYAAHGNYGVLYKITLVLSNESDIARAVTLRLDCPVKTDSRRLDFLDPPAPNVFFRGTLKLDGELFHVVLHRGEKGPALSTFELAPGKKRPIEVELIYQADATPPQMLSITSCPVSS